MACHSFVAFFNRCSFNNGLHDLANLSLTDPLCFVPNLGFWRVVDCKVQWTALFKFSWSAADKFFKILTGHLSPPVATILGIAILRWSFIEDFLVFVGLESANVTYVRYFHLLHT